MEDKFNKDYYERGVETKVSAYQNYRWLPHYSLPTANTIKNYYGERSTVLDYGCAKGFLVKALRLLGVDARGYDISKYAIDNCDPAVEGYVSNTLPTDIFDVIVSKDVLEHVPKKNLERVLNTIEASSLRQLIVVPLGDGNTYRIREYELDKTHLIREDEEWWINQFKKAGLKVDEFYYNYPGIKENWTKEHPYGNGIFFLRRKNDEYKGSQREDTTGKTNTRNLRLVK